MPDQKHLKDTYTSITTNYSQTVAIINAANSWFFKKNMPQKRDAVLDIGCGSGNLLSNISPYFSKSYGIDPVPAMIASASEHFKKPKFSVSNAEKLPFPDESFDYVISHLVFQHTIREQAIVEAKRVLKPGGKLIISEAIIQPPDQKTRLKMRLYRIFWTYPYLVLHHGLAQTIKAHKYLSSSEWQGLTSIHRHRRFTIQEFREFYSKNLPGCVFKDLDLRVECVIWEKN